MLLNSDNISINEFDKLTDVDKQITYLVSTLNLKINNRTELIHVIENYGFNRVFRAYATPFISETTNTFQPNVTDEIIIKLFYFDRKFSTILFEYLGYFENKLSANIIHQVNIDCPDINKQINFLYPRIQSFEGIIKSIQKLANSGSLYVKPFLENHIYPAWIILDTLTLGEKVRLISQITHAKEILENFYINDIQELFFITDNFLRLFRNGTAHFDRMIKYQIQLNTKENLIMQEFLKKYCILNDNDLLSLNINTNYNTFILVMILCHLLSKKQAEYFLKTLVQFFQNGISITLPWFDFKRDILVGTKGLNWPNNWEKILITLINNKISIT